MTVQCSGNFCMMNLLGEETVNETVLLERLPNFLYDLTDCPFQITKSHTSLCDSRRPSPYWSSFMNLQYSIPGKNTLSEQRVMPGCECGLPYLAWAQSPLSLFSKYNHNT